MTDDGGTGFTHEEMLAWYVPYKKKVLEPAMVQFLRLLGEVLDPIVAELGEGRVRSPVGRIKGDLRLFIKLGRDKYVSKCDAPEDIPRVIDDLIGLRVVCTHNSDLGDIVKGLDQLPQYADGVNDCLAVEPGSVRDYVSNPKDTGYRAYHLSLMTAFPALGGMKPVRAELQVRTLLQDGWGELTHEDTYKADRPISGIVRVLARRMGELLATVDDIGQDIQNELTQGLNLDQPPEAVAVSPESTDEPVVEGQLLELLTQEIREFIADLDRPIPLALIANHIQGIFGSDIRTSWFGCGTFKNLLHKLLPDELIVPVGPSYLIPNGSVIEDTWPPSVLAYVYRDRG